MKPKEQAIDVNPDNSDNMKNVKVLCICRHDKKYKIPYRMQKKFKMTYLIRFLYPGYRTHKEE